MNSVSVACKFVQMASQVYEISKDREKYKKMGYKEHSRSAVAKGLVVATNAAELVALRAKASYPCLRNIKIAELGSKLLERTTQFLKVDLENSHLDRQGRSRVLELPYISLVFSGVRTFFEILFYNQKENTLNLPKRDMPDEELKKVQLPVTRIVTGGREGTPREEIVGYEPATREKLLQMHDKALSNESCSMGISTAFNVLETVTTAGEAVSTYKQTLASYQSAAEDLLEIV